MDTLYYTTDTLYRPCRPTGLRSGWTAPLHGRISASPPLLRRLALIATFSVAGPFALIAIRTIRVAQKWALKAHARQVVGRSLAQGRWAMCVWATKLSVCVVAIEHPIPERARLHSINQSLALLARLFGSRGRWAQHHTLTCSVARQESCQSRTTHPDSCNSPVTHVAFAVAFEPPHTATRGGSQRNSNAAWGALCAPMPAVTFGWLRCVRRWFQSCTNGARTPF